MKNRRVLIVGITGQDGSYLAESYLSSGWEVHGLLRRTSTLRRERIDHLSKPYDNDSTSLHLHYSNLLDPTSFQYNLERIDPCLVINLGAQSHVGISFENPTETFLTNSQSVLNQLEAIRHFNPEIVFYQAGTSEMFGGLLGRAVLDEKSTFNPKSPYGVSKVAAHFFSTLYRETYNLCTHNGILFNHESPRRGENFVSRKISLAVARIYLGQQKTLQLGNISASRDWGHARDYAHAIRLISESELPGDDWVVATGERRTVEEFASCAFNVLGLDYRKYLQTNDDLIRPNEVQDLVGDSSKIRQKLGWSPTVNFEELVREMVISDLNTLQGLVV
jgi:GDPmannose 4,6-dehydratase